MSPLGQKRSFSKYPFELKLAKIVKAKPVCTGKNKLKVGQY